MVPAPLSPYAGSKTNDDQKTNTMMNQNEALFFLEDKLPEMKEDLARKSPKEGILPVFSSIQCLTDFMIRQVKTHNRQMLKRGFSVADKLYQRGNGNVKNAIEVVFIHSFSILFTTCATRLERMQLQSLMPLHLYEVYVAQASRPNY